MLVLLIAELAGTVSACTSTVPSSAAQQGWTFVGESTLGDDLYIQRDQSRRKPDQPEHVYVVMLMNLNCRTNCLQEQGWASAILHNSYICTEDGNYRYAAWESTTFSEPFGNGKTISRREQQNSPDIVVLSPDRPSFMVRAWACANLPMPTQ